MPLDEDKINELIDTLEELTKAVTIRGDKIHGMPDVQPMIEALWWEVKHCSFCLWKLSSAESNLNLLTRHTSRGLRYKAARECRASLYALRNRALGKDYGHGDMELE
jgi:hypothetical protein